MCVCVRERWEAEGRESRRDRRQDRNLTRILATLVGEKEKTGSRQETWATEDRASAKKAQLCQTEVIWGTPFNMGSSC